VWVWVWGQLKVNILYIRNSDTIVVNDCCACRTYRYHLSSVSGMCSERLSCRPRMKLTAPTASVSFVISVPTCECFTKSVTLLSFTFNDKTQWRMLITNLPRNMAKDENSAQFVYRKNWISWRDSMSTAHELAHSAMLFFVGTLLCSTESFVASSTVVISRLLFLCE